MTEKIDAVITWVDGSDPEFVAKKQRVMRMETPYKKAINALSDERYTDSGELYYCIRLLRRNAPWIHTIFLVTDNQCPTWLGGKERSELGVELVSHNDIFRGHLDKLPTFNSRSIETMLHRINGLSEKLIYFNDDCFIVRSVRPEDFFDGGSLIVRGRWGIKNYAIEKKWRRLTFWHRRGYVCRRPGVNQLPGWFRYIDLAHAPHALFKSDFYRVFDEDRTARNITYRFRGEEQLSPVGFVINNSRKMRRVVRKDNDWLCVCPDKSQAKEPVDRLVAGKKRLKFLCLQNLSQLSFDELKEVHRGLNALLAR